MEALLLQMQQVKQVTFSCDSAKILTIHLIDNSDFQLQELQILQCLAESGIKYRQLQHGER